MDVVTLQAAKSHARKTYFSKHRLLARQGFAPPLLALPAVPPVPVVQTPNVNPASAVTVSAADGIGMVTVKNGIVENVVTNTNVDGWRNVVPFPASVTGAHSIYAVEFDIRGSQVSLRLRDNNSSNTAQVWTWVDGVPQTAEYVSCGTTTGGAVFAWNINFGATGRYRVKVYLHNCDFAGFNREPLSVIQPTPSGEPVMGILADSWGAGANGVLPGRTFLQTTAILLGCQAFMCAQGGTGYVTPTANPDFGIFADPRRITPLADAPLDFLVIEGSLNDDVNSDATPAEIEDAAAELYADWRTLRPDVPIIVIGVQSTGTSPTTGDTVAERVANNNAVKAAAEAAPNVLGFIDPIAEEWVVGVGNAGAPTGAAADWIMASSFHPTGEGSDVLAQRAAARITDILKAVA